MTLDNIDLSTISGIAIAAMLFLEIFKKIIEKYPKLGKLPTYAYAFIIAFVLSYVADQMLHTIHGDWWEIGWKSGISALASSGFYEWLRNGKNTLNSTVENKQ